VSGGHATGLYRPGDTRLHRLPPQCKVLAALLFIVAVVATPRRQVWALVLQAGLLLAVVHMARLPRRTFARRLGMELPFVAFAFLLPFVARGPHVDMGPFALSSPGLWAAWNILAKATIGVGTSIVLAATTSTTDVVRGLERLRVPRAFTSIAASMIRYLDIVRDDMTRMRIARQSRGHDPRWFWQARAVAHSAGALFIRSYERGERVHLAMMARGFDGRLPPLDTGGTDAGQWRRAMTLPLLGGLVAAAAWVVAT
jgi:cobalt/nickel transport system permease protein